MVFGTKGVGDEVVILPFSVLDFHLTLLPLTPQPPSPIPTLVSCLFLLSTISDWLLPVSCWEDGGRITWLSEIQAVSWGTGSSVEAFVLFPSSVLLCLTLQVSLIFIPYCGLAFHLMKAALMESIVKKPWAWSQTT